MQSIRQKLNSRRGVSILLALMLFLAAAMVVAVILSAAVTAAKRVDDDRRQRQEQLAADSAAKMILSCVEDSSVTVTIVTTSVEGEDDIVSSPAYAGSGPLGFALCEAVEKLSATGGPYTVTITPDDLGTEELTPATLTFTMTRFDSDGITSVEKFLVNGTVSVNAGAQKVYLTAWVPDPEGDTAVTHENGETPEGASYTVTTSVQRLTWVVDLSTEEKS